MAQYETIGLLDLLNCSDSTVRLVLEPISLFEVASNSR